LKALLLIIFLFQQDGISRIAEINKYKKEGSRAYMESDYSTSASRYRYLVDSLNVKEDPVILNLAHSYFHLNDTTNAINFYAQLTESKNREIKSVAYQQIGVIEFNQKKYNLSLGHLKNALKANPQNEEARKNYEVLKRLMQENPEMQDQQDDQDIEPSEYAKKLKEQAEMLVRNNRFIDAYNLMVNGMQVDQTVSAYNEFITKLKDVAEVEGGTQ